MNFQYKANLGKRIIATLIDYTIYLIPVYMYIMYFGEDNGEGRRTVVNLMFLPIPVAWFLYFVVVESVYGATLGHQGLDLQVQTIGRAKIRMSHAFKRHLLDPIDIFFYGIPALIAIKVSERHQRLGDMLAETIVVDLKDAEQ
jgi:uncharacterized RDD family membrane protein YckC